MQLSWKPRQQKPGQLELKIEPLPMKDPQPLEPLADERERWTSAAEIVELTQIAIEAQARRHMGVAWPTELEVHRPQRAGQHPQHQREHATFFVGNTCR